MADLMLGGGRCDGPTESGARKALNEYDHDWISIQDLMELGVAAVACYRGDAELPDTEVTPDVPRSGRALPPDPCSASAPGHSVGEAFDDAATPSSATQCAVQDAEPATVSATAAFEAPLIAPEPAIGSLPDTSDVDRFEVLDFDEENTPPAPEDPLDQLWYLEIPEADDEEVVREVLRAGVSSDERATQLALAFLQEEDLFSERHLDLLADIIRHRGWTSVQHQVRGLVLAGYGIAQVHRMFQLTDAWLHCVESDTLAPERWHGGKRLTWLEAAQLLDFIGYDAEFDQIADFLSLEQEVWHGLRRDSGQLATFKNYLFEYRMSPRTQVDDGIWQSNLDPGDARSFDGTRNQLYMSCWWDEPIDGGAQDVRQMFGAICDPARIADWLSPDTEDLF